MPTEFTTQENKGKELNSKRIRKGEVLKILTRNAHSGKPQNILFSSALFDKFFFNNKRRSESAKKI